MYVLWFFGFCREGTALRFSFLEFGGLPCSGGVLVLFEGGMTDGLS